MTFRVFWPPETKNDPDTENTKISYQNRVFFLFSVGVSFRASGAHKTRNTGFSIFASQSTAISAIFSAIWLQICTCGVPNESWQCPLQYLFPAIKV